MGDSGYKRDSNQESLGDVINRMLKVYRLKSGLTETILRSDWKEIVGELIAKHTKDIKVKDGKLFIQVDSAALKQELHYQREEIAGNVNKHLEEDLVKEVVIR